MLKVAKETLMFRAIFQSVASITLLVAANAVVAQTPTTSNQSGVGVSAQNAAEAQQKAVPRSDTATVVRTGPTATDRTREAASTVGSAASAAVDRSTTGRSMADMDARDSSGSTMTARQARPARADRN